MKVHKRILTGYRANGREQAIVLCGKFDPARYSWEDRDVTCKHCLRRMEKEEGKKTSSRKEKTKKSAKKFPGAVFSEEERQILAATEVTPSDPQARRVFEAAVRKGWGQLLHELPKLSRTQRKLAFAGFLRGLEQGFEAATALMPVPKSVPATSIGDYLQPLRRSTKKTKA